MVRSQHNPDVDSTFETAYQGSMPSPRGRRRMLSSRNLAAFYLVIVASALPSLAADRDSIAEDRAHRDAAIHWPKEFDPSVAPVFSHNELLINTDCHRAFTRLTDATDWPNWFPLVKDVVNTTPGPVRERTLLQLKIFNSPIGSRIVEFVPDQRISWIPFGSDETETRHGHYHAWHFIPEPAGCRVITEETGIGPGDVKDPPTGSHLMHKAHELWLDGLKYTSEP